MGLFSFIKNAGEKVFGGSETPAEKAQKVKEHVSKYGFDLSKVTFTAEGDKIQVSGTAKNLDEKQRLLTAAGNVDGVEGVDDNLTLAEPLKFELPDLSKTMYTVKSGDNLSKISKEVYGDPNKYNTIFEANKPMLVHVDKIYPGQVLYIPPQS
ncbi:peptidoglycan-binding protein LysM [Moheibacter sediminis]|uniref:Potassium binding protein Kbp n=1 Tax=Moheibacter sediminis TaxID=1434700 RepID=A0A1W2BR20_9FLAO|nr:peptidoglycan-binding protein LysM [Moheibacter sediminis]SMC75455.1 LysM domain-containing protein [Moheibacter sediminis]